MDAPDEYPIPNNEYPTEQGKRIEIRGHSDECGSVSEFRIYAEVKASFSERE